jgi:hypothetical protein
MHHHGKGPEDRAGSFVWALAAWPLSAGVFLHPRDAVSAQSASVERTVRLRLLFPGTAWIADDGYL